MTGCYPSTGVYQEGVWWDGQDGTARLLKSGTLHAGAVSLSTAPSDAIGWEMPRFFGRKGNGEMQY